MSAAPSEQQPHLEQLMKPEEVAPLFKVRPSTVKAWARRRKIPSTRTPGGEIRVRRSDIAAMQASSREEITRRNQAAPIP